MCKDISRNILFVEDYEVLKTNSCQVCLNLLTEIVMIDTNNCKDEVKRQEMNILSRIEFYVKQDFEYVILLIKNIKSYAHTYFMLYQEIGCKERLFEVLETLDNKKNTSTK